MTYRATATGEVAAIEHAVPAADKHDHNSSKGSAIEAMSSPSERGPQHGHIRLLAVVVAALHSYLTQMIVAEVPNHPWITGR